MAIDKAEFFNLTHYEYGEAYFGSCDGMRYRLAREPLENVFFTPPEKRSPAVLLATVWKEPYAYAKTPEEEKTSATFAVSEEGFDQAIRWFKEQLKQKKWK